MKLKQLAVLASFGALSLAACGGAGSGGASRELTGDVSAGAGGALVKAQVSDDCQADTVIATDTAGNASTAAVAADCTFSISLEAGKAYVISFVLDDQFVASLVFDSGVSGFTGSAIPVSDGSGAIELGRITFAGSVATAANEPLDYVDTDGDGFPDRVDDDDDGDGVEDWDEDDCDLDGMRDDYDDDSECDSVGDGLGRVFEVKPRNDPRTDRGNDRVDLDKEVRARVSCRLDADTVTNDTFRVVSENDAQIECDFRVTHHEYGSRIECEHAADFEADTVYSVEIDGVMCENGNEVDGRRAWSWLTETSDDDDGDEEDSIDDEDDADDDSDDDEDDDDSDDD